MSTIFDPNRTGPVDPREPYLGDETRQAERRLLEHCHVIPRHTIWRRLRRALLRTSGK